MTTEKAAAHYVARHEHEMEQEGHEGRAVFNPHNKPILDLPIIYGFNNGGSDSWYNGQLLAEDGTALGGHVCSHEGYMPYDLGVLPGTRPDRHEQFKEHYPDGYQMEFVGMAEVGGCKGIAAAYAKNQEEAAIAEIKKHLEQGEQ